MIIVEDVAAERRPSCVIKANHQPSVAERIASSARNILGYAGVALGATALGAGVAYVYGGSWLEAQSTAGQQVDRIEAQYEFGVVADISDLELLTLAGAVGGLVAGAALVLHKSGEDAAALERPTE